MKTIQEKFWTSHFGEQYITRNPLKTEEMDQLYLKRFNKNITRSKLNKEFLGKLKLKNILEVGCNVGTQLALLQKQRYKNLYGVELFDKAVQKAKNTTKGINIIQGSVFDIPFKDSYFDLVFTSSVLIHISPKDIKKALAEIYRVSKKYIWGYEYFNNKHAEINYRNNKNKLWKGNFAKLYMDLFPDLKLIKERRMKYSSENSVDSMFLLKKK